MYCNKIEFLIFIRRNKIRFNVYTLKPTESYIQIFVDVYCTIIFYEICCLFIDRAKKNTEYLRINILPKKITKILNFGFI